MSGADWLLFLPVCLALSAYPGPNNILSLTTGLNGGVGVAVLACVGRLAAFALLIAAFGFGLGMLLRMAPEMFIALKAAGAVYLVSIGVRMIRAKAPPAIGAAPAGRGLSVLAREEFVVAFTNPKAILFFTAIVPQFLVPDLSFATQLALMTAGFLVLEVAATAGYAAAGLRLGRLVTDPARRVWINRAGGAALIASAALLLVSGTPAIT